MRTLLVSSLAALIPTAAMAWENTVEDVTHTSQTALYQNVDYSLWLPSADSPLAVQFRAATMGDLHTVNRVDSTLAWDGASLTQWFSGVEDGGAQSLSQDTTLSATFKADIFGLTFTNQFWSEAFSWKGDTLFDTALIPQGWHTSVVRAEAEEIDLLDEVFQVMDGVQLIIAGQVVPNSEVVLSGRYMTVNEKITSELDWPMAMPLPEQNAGTLDMISTWFGTADATFGVDLMPTIGICHDDFGCFETTFTYTWALATDSVEVVTGDRDFKHDMPSIAMANQTVDFGDVLVGESQTLELSVANIGQVDLEGQAIVQGPGFTLATDELLAEGNDVGTIRVTFTPENEGFVTGGVTLFTNDPLRPEVFLPIAGTGYVPEPEPDADFDGDGNGPGYDNNYTGLGGCGCNATPAGPQGALGSLALVAMLLLRRRRA